MAKSGKYDKVYLNRGYNSVDGIKIKPNRQPDVMGVRKGSGKIDAVEVPSKGDKIDVLIGRNRVAQDALPAGRQGTIKIAPVQ